MDVSNTIWSTKTTCSYILAIFTFVYEMKFTQIANIQFGGSKFRSPLMVQGVIPKKSHDFIHIYFSVINEKISSWLFRTIFVTHTVVKKSNIPITMMK